MTYQCDVCNYVGTPQVVRSLKDGREMPDEYVWSCPECGSIESFQPAEEVLEWASDLSQTRYREMDNE